MGAVKVSTGVAALRMTLCMPPLAQAIVMPLPEFPLASFWS
jgi:hypothetical protein